MTPHPAPAPYVADDGRIHRLGTTLAECASPAIAKKWAAILNAHDPSLPPNFRAETAARILAGMVPACDSMNTRLTVQEYAPDYVRVAVWLTDALISALTQAPTKGTP